MAVSLKDLGIEAYMNQKHEAQGGYARFVKLVKELQWPKSQVAQEFGITRPWLNKLIAQFEQEQKDGRPAS